MWPLSIISYSRVCESPRIKGSVWVEGRGSEASSIRLGFLNSTAGWYLSHRLVVRINLE